MLWSIDFACLFIDLLLLLLTKVDDLGMKQHDDGCSATMKDEDEMKT